MKQQWSRRGLSAVCLVAAVAAGCGDSDTSMNGGPVSAGGNTGGAVAGAPSAAAGTPSSGAAAGASGAASGASGASADAAGGAAAGAAAGGAGAPAAGGDFDCGAPSTKAPAEIYAAAAMTLIPNMEAGTLPCAFSSCHNASKKVAGLDLSYGVNISDLVGKQSCEASALKLVEPGGGNGALEKSWLYLKLAAPVDGSSALVADPSWGMPNNTCGQTGGDFGMRMPISGGSDGIGAEKLAIIREWICAGAPAGM